MDQMRLQAAFLGEVAIEQRVCACLPARMVALCFRRQLAQMPGRGRCVRGARVQSHVAGALARLLPAWAWSALRRSSAHLDGGAAVGGEGGVPRNGGGRALQDAPA